MSITAEKTGCEFNGHANHATWLLHVWNVIPEMAEWFVDNRRYHVSDTACRDWFYEALEHSSLVLPKEKNVFTDLLDSIMADIDYRAIAESVNEEINEIKRNL